MSLLEKARGAGPKRASLPNSLFSRAQAAHAQALRADSPASESATSENAPSSESPTEPDRPRDRPSQASARPSEFRLGELEELEARIVSLPRCFDSILAAWSYASGAIPLSALSLLLPRGDFLAPAARSGFPSGTQDEIPRSFARTSQIGVEVLGDDARALLAPILGVPSSLSLRAATTGTEYDFVGLWVYHDPSLDTSSYEVRARVGSFLARIGEVLPPFSLTTPVPDPAASLLDATRKYPSASAFSFDLSPIAPAVDQRLRGLESSAVRSAFLASCIRMLSRSGAAVASGDLSVACVLGSTSRIDPDLALFQFTKTIRRILPFLSLGRFPEGKTLGFDPSSESAHSDLARFLSS